MGAEHDERTIRPEGLTERLAHVNKMTVRALAAHCLQDPVEDGLPVSTTRVRGLIHGGERSGGSRPLAGGYWRRRSFR
jgi:hypothetical protein